LSEQQYALPDITVPAGPLTDAEVRKQANPFLLGERAFR
jgi:hypothetical protein